MISRIMVTHDSEITQIRNCNARLKIVLAHEGRSFLPFTTTPW